MSAENSIHHSSASVEHYTPKFLITVIENFFDGVIGLDPCSNSGIPNVPALHHFSFIDNGLIRPWLSIRRKPTNVFMNPPYGRGIIDKWIKKLCEEYSNGNVYEAITLVPARTSTKWFDRFEEFGCPTCFIDGRLTFIGNDNGAPFPSAICYFGERVERFSDFFSPYGSIWQVVNKAKLKQLDSCRRASVANSRHLQLTITEK